MIIGHIPSGYIFSKLLAGKLAGKEIDLSLLLLTCITGAIAPDIDWLYYFFIDNEKHLHHTYWTHYPIVWTGSLLLFSAWYRLIHNSPSVLLGVVFSAAGLMHIVLDSIVGDILWFAPFTNESFALFSVPELFKPWWLNYVLHWTFSMELLLTFWAIVLWRRNPSFAQQRS
jgi:inner membrane protein